METSVSRWGHSLGVRIPQTYARTLGLKPGHKVQIVLEGDRLVVTAQRFDLATALEHFRPEHRLPEWDLGQAAGREEW